jgi:hypothetical protein
LDEVHAIQNEVEIFTSGAESCVTVPDSEGYYLQVHLQVHLSTISKCGNDGGRDGKPKPKEDI